MAAAALPAILYFLAVWVGIDAFASRRPLPAMDAADLPSGREVGITAGFFVIPFAVLLWGIFGPGFTPQYAAALAIGAAALLLPFGADLRTSRAQALARAEAALMAAGRQVSMIAAIILCASIVIGVLGITGLGVKITSLILSGSGGMLWASLLLTALACLLLGMEVPTTAAYVICVSVAGPALIDLGMEPLRAHLFVFWFALLSTITPPVCGAVFIAAGMVGENWLRVAGVAMALGVGLYLIPLAMAAQPALIALASDPAAALVAAARTALGLAAISRAALGAWPAPLRAAALAAGGALLFAPSPV
jgi:TRAP-type uncharacterized transport system fused permease subunit